MWLIATDEAGYGPKLGPLTIVATTWRLPDSNDGKLGDWDEPFKVFANPTMVQQRSIRIDDSKAVYQPASVGPSTRASVGTSGLPWNLETLHLITGAASLLTDPTRQSDLCRWLDQVNASDRADRRECLWLSGLEQLRLPSLAQVAPLMASWANATAHLVNTEVRVITAKRFNQWIDSGRNKADLLTEATLGLIARSLDRIARQRPGGTPVHVFSDRHGGRRYYAGVLQQQLGTVNSEHALWRILEESKTVSHYRLADEIEIRFTVKGDRFTPVAMSSLIAKYLRECGMHALNEYFGRQHRGMTPLRKTAGYPVDADRFLEEIRPIVAAEKIVWHDLVRKR